MGKTRGPYNEEFPKGSTVKIADRAFLAAFLEEWQRHNRLEPDQLEYAGRLAEVDSVGFITVEMSYIDLRIFPGSGMSSA